MFSLGATRPPMTPADKRLVCIRSPLPRGAPPPRRRAPPDFSWGLPPTLRSPIDSVESLGWYETEGVGMGWDERRRRSWNGRSWNGRCRFV